MKAALRTVTTVSFFLLTVSGIHVSRAHAFVPCGGDNEPCCETGGCDSGFVCEPVCDLWTLDGQGGGAVTSPCFMINPIDQGSAAQFMQIGGPGGTCQPCGGNGEPCCDLDTCDSGFVCEPLCPNETLEGQGSGAAGTPCGNTEQIEAEGGELRPTVCQPCGGAAEPCCDEMSCNEGFTCMMGYTETADQGGAAEGLLNGSCFPCGALGDPCCDDSMCSGDNLLCGGEFCEACGAIGEQCCANNTCPNAAAICLQGTCEALPAAPAMGTWGLAALLLTLTGIGAFRLRRG